MLFTAINNLVDYKHDKRNRRTDAAGLINIKECQTYNKNEERARR